MSGDLFSDAGSGNQPLAALLRPSRAADIVGQQHLLGESKPITRCLQGEPLHSMILWGPPGVGKTTLATLLSESSGAKMVTLSAVMDGVKAIRDAVAMGQTERSAGRQCVLFVDEVHRFNKAQQDAFLPFVEDGTLTLIGATTENPAFELNSALLSRARVYRLHPLEAADLEAVLKRGESAIDLELDDEQRQRLALAADGDARRVLNYLELAQTLADPHGKLDDEAFEEVLRGTPRRFDKAGDAFYDVMRRRRSVRISFSSRPASPVTEVFS